MNSQPKVLLINPPLWNAFAPHLAVPLLRSVLADNGWRAEALDLGIEQIDWLLSTDALPHIFSRLEKRAAGQRQGPSSGLRRALGLMAALDSDLTAARKALRSLDTLSDHDLFRRSAWTLRNAMYCISHAFEGLEFDLVQNTSLYSTRSTTDVIAATADPEKNIYAWALEHQPPAQIDDPDIGIVGISVSADAQLVAAMTVARVIKTRRSDVKVVMGGNFTTRMVERWTGPHPFFRYVDYFVLYEGEESLPMLCRDICEDSEPRSPGLAYLDSHGDLRKSPARPVSLENLPVPDYRDYPLEKYLAPGPVLPLQASRSCAWNCAFCSIPFASNKFRKRDAARVVDDMEELSRRHGTRHFMFVDEILTMNSLRTVANELTQRRSGLFWYGETRFSKGLDDATATLLFQSGCRRLDLGLESYNQRVLDLMAKGINVNDVDPAVNSLLGAGVPVHLFTMTGFPGERSEESERTQRYVSDVLDRSATVYGNPYTTAANGPFILDALSPVGMNPGQFGVELIQPPDGWDLTLTLDYTVADGLSQEQARELADRDPRSGRDKVQGWPWIGDAEEYIFLAAATGSGRADRVSPATGRGKVLAFELDGPTPRLSGRTSYAAISADRSAEVIYHSGRDMIAEIPSSWLSLLISANSRGLSLESTLRHMAPDTESPLAALARLADSGFIEPPVAHDLEYASFGETWLCTHEVNSVGKTDDGSFSLELESRGYSVSVSAAPMLVWSLANKQPTTLDQLRSTANFPEKKFSRAVRALISSGLAVAYATKKEAF